MLEAGYTRLRISGDSHLGADSLPPRLLTAALRQSCEWGTNKKLQGNGTLILDCIMQLIQCYVLLSALDFSCS